MKLTKLSIALLGCASMTAGVASAAAPTLKEVLGASDITVSGFVDGGYTYFDTDAGSATGTASVNSNYMDGAYNSFRFKQGGLTIASQPAEGFGALVNVTAGDDAVAIHSSDGSTGNIDVTQAFVQYASSGFTVIGGKYNTLAGAEVIAPTGNTNISRSVAFLWSLPFTHTGVRVSYAAPGAVTLYAGYNNGWDQAQDGGPGGSDGNGYKTTELGVSWAPADIFNGAVYSYVGDGGYADGGNKKTLIDVVATIKPIAPLAIVINYDTDKIETTGADYKWDAINLYLNYQISEKLRTSLRAEQFNDKDGWNFGTVDNKITGLTLTVGYSPVPAFELRGEVRQDKADAAVYTKDGVADDTQVYAAVEGIYKF